MYDNRLILLKHGVRVFFCCCYHQNWLYCILLLPPSSYHADFINGHRLCARRAPPRDHRYEGKSRSAFGAIGFVIASSTHTAKPCAPMFAFSITAAAPRIRGVCSRWFVACFDEASFCITYYIDNIVLVEYIHI